MKKTKIFAILLTFVLAMTMFAGCGEASTSEVSGSEAGEASTSEVLEPEAGETRIVVDHAGNEVEIPKEVKRIVIAGIPQLVSVYTMTVGSADKLVGIGHGAYNSAVNSILIEFVPELADLPYSFLMDTTDADINIEELIKLNPDVVFNHANIPQHHEACVQAGIPSVQFSPNLYEEEDYNPIKTMNAWVQLIGEVLGTEDLTAPMLEFGESVEQRVRDVAANIPDEDKAEVLVLTNYNGNTITAGAQTFSKYWIQVPGGIYLTNDIPNFTVEIDMERVYEMDPEVIFLSSFTSITPEDIINSTAGEGHDWSNVRAVQNGRVYKFPLGTFHWFSPTADSPLALLWVASTLYPEWFEDIDINKEIKDYYNKYYGVTITDEDVAWILNPSGEAGFN